jgi:hypothetical protein
MIDLVLALGFAGAAWAGWRQGFIRQLIGLAILAAGVIAALDLRGVAVPLVQSFLSKQPAEVVDMVAAAVVFLVVVIGGNVAVSLGYRRVPFLSSRHLFDEALGAALSVGLRAIELSVVLIIIDAFYRRAAMLPVAGVAAFDGLAGILKDSAIAAFLRAAVVPVLLHGLGPLVPEAYRALLNLPAK